jgi:chromosome segregation ATPase
MSKDISDYDIARSGLSNALNVIGQVFTALQQAEQVFSVVHNADKHGKALAKDVDTQKKELASLEEKIAVAQAHIVAVAAEIGVAEADASARIETVLAAEKKTVSDAKKAAADKVATALSAADSAIQDANTKASNAQAMFDIAAAGLLAKETELTANIAHLETKLTTLKAQAQKFAAALVGE